MTTDRSGDGGWLPIGDYALLSDCHSTALVSSSGSIDWACLRRFDSGSAFGRLLDRKKGGYFSITPVDPIIKRTRRYRPETMVLETILTTATGSIRIIDAFAMREGGSSEPRAQLLREVEAIDHPVEVEVIIEPKFDYGSTRPWLRSHTDGRFSAVGGNDALAIDADIPLTIDRTTNRIIGRRLIGEGNKIAITMVSQPSHLFNSVAADARTVADRLDETTMWWAKWSANTNVDGPHAELVRRSALVLKSLCCAPTGAIIAAPTTSLPEIPGGSANWDYRYCWVRDATLTLDALAEVGHPEVAQGFRDFIMRSSAGHGDDLQIMYGTYGERRLPEMELDLEGWRNSTPVRVGNDAVSQTQLDVFGHLVGAAHLWHSRVPTINDDEWRFLSSVINAAIDHRNNPDAGIWELRNTPQHYVHSKVMVWVALDCGIRLVEDFNLDERQADLERWRRVRDEIRQAVDTQGVDPQHGHFVQHFGSRAVDASLLKLPLVGFVDANDPRMVATVEAIQRDLVVEPEGFLLRFNRDHLSERSGGTTSEGVFLLCSFWLVEVLVLQGRIDEATDLFERLLQTGNDVGLFSEEYNLDQGELLGNFPQAFTHLGLISADRRLRAAHTAKK